MKVLVVEDEPTAQRVIQKFLERSGYESVLVDDGQKAFELASAVDAPPLMLLDWMLPGMDGPSICKALREAKPKIRPYVIMLSSKTSKEDVAAGLDAGADDYVSKPFNIAEMQARLRVACRAIQYQYELQRQLEENERLSQRNSLLSEIISKRREPLLQVAPVAVSTEPESGVISAEELFNELTPGLAELRITIDELSINPEWQSLNSNHYGAWSSVMIISNRQWVDLLLVAPGETIVQLFEHSLGRHPTNMSEGGSFWAELARVAGLALIHAGEARGLVGVLPSMSRTIPLGGGPQGRTLALPAQTRGYLLKLNGQTVQMSLSTQHESALAVSPKHLRELDILAESFPPQSQSGIALFKEGTVMTDRFIEKLIYRGQDLQEETILRVYRPSPLAKYIHRYF